ncbi:MAG: OstA-like protein [Dysgonomonas sp.]
MFKQQHNLKNSRHRIHILGILCFLVMYVSASVMVQPHLQKPVTPPKATVNNKKKIEMRKAGIMLKRDSLEYQILIDSVVLYHDGAIMYCDSAYMDDETNSFDAFGNISVNQGDTLFMYGNFMHYNGNNKLLEIRKNVRLENDKDMTLFTDSLNYDRVANLAYYFQGGMLVDKENELTSYWGQYQPGLKLATFRDSVKLVNDRFTIYSDVLKYTTDTKIATIVGPSTIVSDSGTIYTSNGWYNTVTDEALLLDRSLLLNKEGNRTLTGDSIFYNKVSGYGEVFGNMVLQDTLKKVILKGNYGYYNEQTDFALATDSAFCIEYSQKDTLFLHGDTLKLRTDSVIKNNREIEAVYNVRFFRTDVQGVCDSLLYRSKDSVLYLYKDPVLWNEKYQISGDTIEAYFNDSTIDMAYIKQYSFAIEDVDSLHYNQLKGRDMKIYFENKEMNKVVVEGNAESIFYPLENDGSMIGQNQTESSYLMINLLNKKINRIKMWPKSSGTLTPLPDLTLEKMNLRDFQWFDYLRPLDKDDIFRRVRKKAGTESPKRSNRFNQNR